MVKIYECRHCGELIHEKDISKDTIGKEYCSNCGHSEKLQILLTHKQGIVLKNINLSGISIKDQNYKISEEEQEFIDAFNEFISNKTMRNKYHLIEEFFDEMQTKLGLLELVGIAAQEVTDQYYKHEEKLKNRPRKKKTCLKCFNMQHKEIKYICLKCGQEVERQDFNSYANECSYYKET